MRIAHVSPSQEALWGADWIGGATHAPSPRRLADSPIVATTLGETARRHRRLNTTFRHQPSNLHNLYIHILP